MRTNKNGDRNHHTSLRSLIDYGKEITVRLAACIANLHWMTVRRVTRATVATLAVATVSIPSGATTLASTRAAGTAITTAEGPFGTMLVVGSGKYAGYSLYFISSDVSNKFGCTTTVLHLGGNSLSCTGPANDQHAEWPAITTTGAPVAGAGVTQGLLGTVSRKGIGDQITYAGHPLYLFDQGPAQVTGEGWDEPGIPPFHGVWWVMTPAGLPLPWPGTLTVTTIANGQTVVAAIMLTGGGFKSVPVYTFTKDSASASACTGSCAVSWPPVLTESTPGVTNSITASKIGTIKRADGTEQVTYNGKPLYLYSLESQGTTKQGKKDIAGSGAGVTASGGTFELVAA